MKNTDNLKRIVIKNINNSFTSNYNSDILLTQSYIVLTGDAVNEEYEYCLDNNISADEWRNIREELEHKFIDQIFSFKRNIKDNIRKELIIKKYNNSDQIIKSIEFNYYNSEVQQLQLYNLVSMDSYRKLRTILTESMFSQLNRMKYTSINKKGDI